MNNQCFGEDEIVAKIDATFTTLDQQRIQGLERLQKVQSVQNTALQREQQRLIAKYGENHPRVQKINTRLTYNQGLQNNLTQEINRSKINVSQFNPQTWKGEGLVLDKNGVGIKGLTVSFVDEKGNWIRPLGYACTDEKGYFSLVYPKEVGTTSRIEDDQPLFLIVTDQNHRQLHREATSRAFKIGRIEFWRIILGDDNDNSCEPPSPPDDKPAIIGKIQTSPLEPTTQTRVTFKADVQGDNPIKYQWSFGDGSTSTEVTPTHLYSQPKTYQVTLTVANSGGGGTDSRTIEVKVQDASVKLPLDGSVIWFQQKTLELRQDQEIDPENLLKLATERTRKFFGEQRNPQVVLTGYTSKEGIHEKNLELSRMRAMVVQERFTKGDIPIDRLKIVAQGEDATYPNPVDNERVEIQLISQ